MYSCMPVYMSSDDDIKSCMMTYSYHLLEINKYRNVLLAKHPSSSRTDITVISGGSVKGEYAALTMAVIGGKNGGNVTSFVTTLQRKPHAVYSPATVESRHWCVMSEEDDGVLSSFARMERGSSIGIDASDGHH